ncbi:hypothetical protein ACWIG5_37050 [Streptomyces lydicus]
MEASQAMPSTSQQARARGITAIHADSYAALVLELVALSPDTVHRW